MNTLKDLLDRSGPGIDVLARLLLALIFIGAGWSKIGGYEATQGYMAAMGVPGALLPLVIVTELGGGLALLIGLLTRVAGLGLAVFSIVSAVLFHADFSNPVEQIMFMKNLAIAGGLLLLVAHGAGRYSVDARLFR
ncbi:DoxX family protein [Polycyclovorans algicola]|uniref:DoxX family protein n=1 Tax=Polycyclovorans algicola TaxID=616992 RepID=UPI0004A6C371|nr:DoxX family protein [Polycyclovorans algicola]